ncbi:type VII secretion protein EsaA [Carnobacterium gallinarum]|uniref:type VII secretion protein EsaA n=1 Tax=Carnobacterium gallinarum TaxID=2749 RepID=UPI000558D5C7|nr:type VII secretion protein EsaA [Carnobacterium gallinarum]
MKKKLVIGVIFLGLVGILGFSLTYMGLFTSSKADVEQEEQVAKMRIALVNEDLGTEYGGIPFSLGENYVKKIEKDMNQNWYVVSRSIAESGLANDTYNLMIVVPSDFSANTFSLDEVIPEKAEVSYKINANGNKDVENEAVKVAKNTIAELNKDLIDVYISSILENLYTAQKNVGTVIGNQVEKINIYGDQVYEPLEGYTNQFSSIKAIGEQSKTGIEQHKSVLKNYLESVVSYGTNQSEFDKSLQVLISEQEKNKLDYTNFTTGLTDYGLMLGNEETQALYERLVEQNKLIGNEFTSADMTLLNQIRGTEEYIADVKATILQQKEAIENQFEDDKKVLTQSVTEKLSNEYNLNRGKLSIAQLLAPEGKDLNANLAVSQAHELERINNLANKISQLVYWNERSLADSPYPDGASKGEMTALLSQIKNYLSVTSTNDNLSRLVTADEAAAGNLQNPPHATPAENPDKIANYKDLNSIKVDLVETEDRANYSQLIYDTTGGVKDYSVLTNLNLNVVVPSEVKVTSAAIKVADGERQLSSRELRDLLTPTRTLELSGLTLGSNFYLHLEYQFNRAGASDPDFDLIDLVDKAIQLTITPVYGLSITPPIIDPPPSVDNPVITPPPPIWIPDTPLNNSQTIGFPTNNFDKTDYLVKLRAYDDLRYANGVWTGKYIQDYQTVLDELALLFGPLNSETGNLDNLDKPRQASKFYNELINDTENFNVFDLLVKLMLIEPTAIYNDYLASFTNYEVQADEMELKVAGLNDKIVETTETAKQLNQEVDNQLDNLRDWQKKISELEREGTMTDALTEGEHQGTKQIDAGLKGLLVYSEGLKTNSESNIEDLKTVNSVFDTFNQDALAIQNSGLAVTENTKSLMNQFQGQVKETEDFSKTFNEVLKNGQQNGVINNQLVDFLASPVKEKDNGRISSGDAYYPYLIIIALFITAVFTAYVLDLKVWQVRQLNSFQVEENLLIRNLPLVLFGLIAAIAEGGMIAFISFRMQQLNTDIQLNWILIVVLIQIVFVFMATYLQRQFKMLGMFINLFLFASYLLLTEAVGKALDSETIFYRIRDFSPLNTAETILSNSANQIPNPTSVLVNFLILIPIVIVLNLVVWFPKEKEKSQPQPQEVEVEV